MVTRRQRELESEMKDADDTNGCTVMAYALITGMKYTEAELILRERYGRVKRRGMHMHELREALRDAGFEIIPIAQTILDTKARHAASSAGIVERAIPSAKRAKDFKKVKTALTLGIWLKKWMPCSTVLVSYHAHTGVFINGINHDWTNGRRHRVLSIEEVRKR